MYVVLFSFVTNPVPTAASLICVTISVAVTDQPSICISSAYAIDCHVLLKIVPFGLVFLITFSSAILNSVVDSASSCLKPLSVPNTFVN